MWFLNPGFLWFLGLLGPLFALYFIKSKPNHRIVPSNIIWRLVVSRVHPNSFLQKFQNSIFLLLQALAITLAVLALARPTGLFSEGLRRLIIIDVSGSMASNDLSPSRLAMARKRAEDLCNDPGRAVGIFTLSDRIDPVLRVVDNSGLAKVALRKVEQTNTATPDAKKVLRLLRDLESWEPDEIFILTDTVDLAFPKDFMPQTALHVETFGKNRGNVGIVGAQGSWDDENRVLRSTLEIKNTSGLTMKVSLRVREKSLDSFPIYVGIEAYETIRVNLPPIPLKKATVELSAPDAANTCPADDVWYLCESGIRPVVLVDAAPKSILFQLARALPFIDFQPFSPAALGEATAVFSENARFEFPKTLPACVFSGNDVRMGEGEILPYEKDHPLTRFSNWDAAPVGGLRPGNFPGIPLVEGISGKLLTEEIRYNQGKRVSKIWVGIAPEKTVGSIFLPILLYNVLEYLLRDAFPSLSYPIGHPSLITLWSGPGPLTAGFYSVPGREGIEVAVNLQDPSEVEVGPASPQQPTPAQAMRKKQKEQEESPWQAFICLALLFLLGEWYFFMRRS